MLEATQHEQQAWDLTPSGLRDSSCLKSLSNQEACKTPVRFLGWEDPLERDRLPAPVFSGFSWGSAGKESACNAGDLGSILGLGRPLEKKTATHSGILAWRIPWTV